jgi:hypothetical protein
VKISAENRKQTILAAVVGAIAIGCVIYMVTELSSSPSVPTPTAPVVTEQPVAVPRSTGRPAMAVVSSASRLDPTLHMEAMLLTESLEYTGTGRNIFSANSAPLAVIPKPLASARTTGPVVSAPVYSGPPPPPPIDLRFFGTATKPDGTRQAFLLRGDDVFLAAQGDIVSRRYQVKSISPNSVEVTDLQNNNTQRLPLTVQ